MPYLNSPKYYVEVFSARIKDSRGRSVDPHMKQSLEQAREVVEKYSSEIMEQWNKEIDGWLIFVSSIYT